MGPGIEYICPLYPRHAVQGDQGLSIFSVSVDRALNHHTQDSFIHAFSFHSSFLCILLFVFPMTIWDRIGLEEGRIQKGWSRRGGGIGGISADV